jgi:hypothetical protein
MPIDSDAATGLALAGSSSGPLATEDYLIPLPSMAMWICAIGILNLPFSLLVLNSTSAIFRISLPKKAFSTHMSFVFLLARAPPPAVVHQSKNLTLRLHYTPDCMHDARLG